MSYNRSVQNYMRVSEQRSSEASSFMRWFGRDSYWRVEEAVAKELAPERNRFQAWHRSLPPTVMK